VTRPAPQRRCDLTQEQLKAQVHYDPLTGIFTRLVAVARRVRVGDVAGRNSKGYIRFRVLGAERAAHRLAWLYMMGVWPTHLVDHRNGVGTDNHWLNLREADDVINNENRRRARRDSITGFLGVSPNGSGYQAAIVVSRKRIRLGTYKTPALAHSAYLDAKRQLHGGCTL
jgi:hypothetical protein